MTGKLKEVDKEQGGDDANASGFKPLPNSSPAQPVGLKQCRLLSYFNEGFCPKNAAATQWIHNAVVYTFT